jgi:hypothetical protein
VPEIRERVLAAEILVVATPTWLGQPSSVSKRALERMDALLSETREDGKTPIAYNRVAGVVVVGNEDGAHHVIAEINAALNDIGYTLPGQNGTYWNKGPGPGEEEWLTPDDREWSTATGRPAAQNLLTVAPRAAGQAGPAAARLAPEPAAARLAPEPGVTPLPEVIRRPGRCATPDRRAAPADRDRPSGSGERRRKGSRCQTDWNRSTAASRRRTRGRPRTRAASWSRGRPRRWVGWGC